MTKRYSKKFWTIFWLLSLIFLAGWYFFWQLVYDRKDTIDTIISILPISQDRKSDLKATNLFADYFLKNDNKERVFMVLLQNNMELRPGGGHIGSFGILKIKNRRLHSFDTYDVVDFDEHIPNTTTPPYPLEETMHVNSWKLRDVNFSPDFMTNAQNADHLYHLGSGQENLDGIIAINTDILASFLKVTGPVEIPGYPGRYDSENAILSLEYQVEKGFIEQGIAKSERKSVMNSLADEIIKKAMGLSGGEKLKLAEVILEDLHHKDIQLYFKDPDLERKAQEVDWAGLVDASWDKDYLMMVDANLGSYKSDYYIKRSFDYTIDLSKEQSEAHLKLTYEHTAKQKDWMTRDYQSYLRIYAPEGSSFDNVSDGSVLGKEFGKNYIGQMVEVPLGETRVFEFDYVLPREMKEKTYDLLIQKQSGSGNVPGKVTIINSDGSRNEQDVTLTGDWTLNE